MYPVVIECECILAIHMQRGIFYKHSFQLWWGFIYSKCFLSLYCIRKATVGQLVYLFTAEPSKLYFSHAFYCFVSPKCIQPLGKVKYSQTKEEEELKK